MFRTLKNKITFGVLMLVLVIQVTTGVMQYNQVQTIFFKEFLLGAKSIAYNPLGSLSYKVDTFIQVSFPDKKIDEERVLEAVDLHAQMVQARQFEKTMLLRDDLLELQFVNFNNELISLSQKTEKEIQHKNKAKTEDLKISEISKSLSESQKEQVIEVGDKLYIFIPFFVIEKYMGGMVLVFNNDRIAESRLSTLYTSLGLFAFFTLISIAIVVTSLSSILSRPTKKMIILLQELAKGHFDQSFEVKNKDEIGEMGLAVNDLVQNLRIIINDLNNVMGGVEQGDLSRLVSANLQGDLDKLKGRVNQSISMLSNTISTVFDSGKAVERSAMELVSSSDVLSSSTARQAATLEEISSSITEIENHAKQNMENSIKAKEISEKTMDLVNKGNQQMIDMQASMNQINNTSSDVTKIIKVIDEIAFQTNLLALNAAVEAARAGKYGKGFAVVAEEVRNLAARSAEAAKNSTALIETSVKEVEKGVEQATLTGSVLTKIVSEVESSNELVSKIALASQEQSQGITEVNSGINQVNQTVQQNSATSEETASSAQLMLQQSSSLQQEMQRFHLQHMEQGLLEAPEQITST